MASLAHALYFPNLQTFACISAAVAASYLCVRLFLLHLRLRHVPGPFWCKVSDVPRALWVKTMRSHEIHADLHGKYGDCVRMGPNMVSISDPAAIPTIYPMRAGFPKSKFYRAFIPYTIEGSLPAIFTTQDERQHKILKSPVAPLYSMTNTATVEPFVDKVIQELTNQLDRRFIDSKTIFDLSDWLQYFAFEAMGNMTFSRGYGLLENGTDKNGMLAAIWDFMLTVGPMTQIPWLDKLLHKNRLVLLIREQLASPILKIVSDAITSREEQINSGAGENTTTKDFLGQFLDIKASNESIEPWYVRAWTFSNVIAGSDSTAVVMRTVIYNLVANPDSYNRVYEELLAEEAKSNLSRPFPRWREIKDLPYLDACINEAVRLHPPFSLPLERVVPDGGIIICGKYFPSGTVVGMNPYVVNRHVSTFGEDAHFWRPERWLIKDVDQRRRLDASIMTFGAGRRICLGKNIALLEIQKVVTALVLNFEIDLVDPSLYKVENSYFFRQRGFYVKIKRRETY